MNVLTNLDRQLVIGHRGNAAHAPENTLESFAQAISLGVDAIELDVRVTADGVPVVIHDPTLGRTTDHNDSVAEVPASRLQRADAGAAFTPDAGESFPYRGRGLTIPTLADVLSAFPTTPLLIEVKVPEAAAALYQTLASAGATDRVVAASMQRAAVAPLRKSGLATGAAAADVLQLLPRALLGRKPPPLPQYDALFIPPWYYGIPLPVAALARLARAVGVATHVWTIDDARGAQELWKAGIQGIVTNDPAAMIRARAALISPPGPRH